MRINSLKIGTWNIQGFNYDKLGNPDFTNFISNMHVFSLVETWSDSGNILNIPGFVNICNNTRCKHKKARRNSGGISVYCKPTIAQGISIMPVDHTDILCIKLNHIFFNLKNDIFVAFIYFSPENSTELSKDVEEMFSILLSKIEKYSCLGEILIQGDFNAYTHTTPDFVELDDSSYPNSDDTNYFIDTCKSRNNFDTKKPNKSGKLLLDLCKESGIRILNGRTSGDIFGKYTCHKYNGSSTVDYAVASANLLPIICNFYVHDFTTLSDHCSISCTILTSFYTSDPSSDKTKISPHIGKFLWNPESINRYTAKIQSTDIRHKLTKFQEIKFKTSDEAVTHFNNILQEAAMSSAKFIRGKIKNKNNKSKRKPCFTQSCKDLRNTVKHYASLINKFPFNGSFCKEYHSYLSKYRRKYKQEENNYRNDINKNLYNNMSTDPKVFWDQLNKLKKSSNTSNSDEITNQKEFLNFFQKLSADESSKNNSFHETILTKLSTLITNIANDNTLYNNPITSDEVLKAVKSLKNGKSTSTDLISNEMIKTGMPILVTPLLKIFNMIFDHGTFPKIWNESLITLIHKKGNKQDPANYRGISLTSNLGKLFNKVLYNRLSDFVKRNKILCPNQIGFKEKARTADHIFSLKSIIEYKKNHNKKVFAAFIDLRKAFDTIWRTGLFYKLLDLKVPFKIFKVLRSMYQDTTCRLKFSNGLSEKFISSCGVKQGDVLSPLLFNLYINDLVKVLEHNNVDPVTISETSINSLLFADDIILLSNSEKGLQKSLNTLQEFCNSWKLKINSTKSKVIVFNSNGKSHKTFLNTIITF